MCSYGGCQIARKFFRRIGYLYDGLLSRSTDAAATDVDVRRTLAGNCEKSTFLPSNLPSSVRIRTKQALRHNPSTPRFQLKERHMHRKSLVLTIVIGLSLAIFATDVFAQRGGRGRGGSGGGEPGAEGAQAPAAGRGRGGGAQAGGRFGGGQSALFAALDANSDGVIAKQEMEDAIQAFAKLDKDRDGKLTAQEAGSSPQSPAAGRGGRGGRGGAGGGAPAAGRGRGRGGQGAEGGAGRGGRGAAQPANPPAREGNSKSPFDD